MDWTRGRTIGRGSTATVSVATADQSGHVFAVKSSELSRSEYLRREQRILSTLSCPHVVGYKGCDISSENGKLLYNLFLEYAPSGTLTDAIQKRQGGGGGGLDEATVRSHTRGILLGLEYLHSIGIVHCDIKGQNILVTDDGVKIADLGCARRADTAAASVVGFSVAGTPVYMAPEVARGEQQGFPADVWALGCTVIEMATGRAPWPDVGDPVSALYRIGYSSEVPEIPSNISEQAKNFLTKCLKRNPVERWSAAELLQHDFVKESNFPKSKLDTPTSVLPPQLWDSMQEFELETVEIETSCRSKCFMQRIRQLGFAEEPDWEWDEQWVTVRSNEINLEQVEQQLSVSSHADELATSYGGDTTRVSKIFDLFFHDYPTTISGEISDKISRNSGESRCKASSLAVCKYTLHPICIKSTFFASIRKYSFPFPFPCIVYCLTI